MEENSFWTSQCSRCISKIYGKLLRRVKRLILYPLFGCCDRFSKTFDGHSENLRKVLQRLREHGVKLKPRKCNMFRKEVNFVGRIISPEGYKLDHESIKPILHMQKSTPKTVGDVRCLPGLL